MRRTMWTENHARRVGVLLVIPIAVMAVLATATTASAEIAAATAAQQQSFVANSGSAAKPSQQEFGVPSSVTIAQAILESNWGTSDLAVTYHNYFGMKCKDGNAGSIANGCANHATRECDGGCHDATASFRTYASMADSFRDHGYFLRNSPRYAPAFNYTNNPDQFAREIHKAGYATDPQYSDKLIKLMQQFNLYQFN